MTLAAQLLGGRVFWPRLDDSTPRTGMAKFLDSEGYERTLDFLEQPQGLKAEDVRNTVPASAAFSLMKGKARRPL